MRTNSNFFWLIINFVLLIVKKECSKQGEYKFLLNKSYDIFIDNELPLNRTKSDLFMPNQFRLKCDLTIDKNSNDTDERDEFLNQYYQIKWFKLNPHKLLILHDYTQNQLEQLNDPLMSDLSIYPIETDLSDEQQFSLSSNLIFNYRYNRDSLLKINGVYLCKLSPKKNETSSQKSLFFQSMQQIAVNEFDQEDQTEDVSFKLLQHSSTYILVEIISNHTLIYYSLINSQNDQIIVKGKIYGSDYKQNKHYLFMETLEPSTSYTLKLYSSKKENVFKKMLFINLTTMENDQKDSNKDIENDPSFDSNHNSYKRAINCELNVKESDSNGQNFQSLFTKLKSKKKYQIVTINYFPNLVETILQDHIKQPGKYLTLDKVENFSSFFELIKFYQKSQNYITNYECLKQFKKFKSTKPLCIFDFPIDVNNDATEDYDYYDSTSYDDEEPNFNIHTSIDLELQTRLHISSRCIRSNRLARVPNGRSINYSSVKNSASEQIIFPLKEKTSVHFLPITKVQITEQTAQNMSQPKAKQLSSYKKETVGSILPNYLAKHMTNINNCYIINNREIQFQIDSNKISDNIYGNGKIPPQINRVQLINRSLPYYYYIEIFGSDLPANLNGQTLNQRYRTVFKNLAIMSRFKLRIFNSSQVVKANLSNRASKNLTVNPSTNSTKSSKALENLEKQVNVSAKKLKSKKSLNQDKNHDSTDYFDLEANSSIAERLDASKLNDIYVFKVKILTEDNTNLNEFDVNVHCKKMNTTLTLNSNGPIDLNQNDANNSFFGLVLTILCAVIIIIAGCLFCLVIKRKYGLNAPNYLLNFKNSFFLKPSNINLELDPNCKMAKKSRTFQYHHQYQQQQYQLEPSKRSNLSLANNQKASTFNPVKPHSFNFNYVRMIRQKLQARSSQSPSYSLSISSSNNSKINIDESSNLLKRIRQFFKLEENERPNFVCMTQEDGSTGTSSSSSSPLVVFTRPTDDLAHADVSAISSISNTETSLFVYQEDNDAIQIEAFEDYVQKMHIDGDFGFAQLYEEITNATKAYSFSSEISLLECNRCKNRYSNILTYEHSRVKLSHDEKDESCGYINANYVDGYQKSNAYIATQGPMPNTFADFWRMILEKNCSIVVMITNVKEKGRIKCDQYWPDEGIEFYGNIQVTHLHTIIYAFYTKRIFTIKTRNSKKRGGIERLVYQYHFTDWPDHGVPYYILPVLSFIKKSSRSNPELGGPIVVHCSAGVGRTGTYIVIDAMMKQIKHKSSVNIHNFLKHIRHQRNYLVQTEEQFIFIYDVLLEAYKCGETELNNKNIESYIKKLNETILPDSSKLIDKQFELITEFKPKDYQISAGNMHFNQEKNRNQIILPVNNSRVVLSRKPGIEGSEYINATYLNGCNRQDEFIVTQYPKENTKLDFWQMVWDNNSSQIVVLNSEETDECVNYWLPIGEPMKCDSFTVILNEENFDMDFAVRDFLLQSIDEDYEFTCSMITASYWPDSCTPIKSAFDLINKVKQFRLQMINANISNTIASNYANFNTNQSPLIVHDLLGGHRAATFCALFSFQDSIYLENSCNVYELAKMYHLKRPNIWSHKSNIEVLYEAVKSLFEEIHSSNQYQFKTYLNMNIENHFNFMYSQSMSMANLATKIPTTTQPNTLTLPNLSNKIDEYKMSESESSKFNEFYKSEPRNAVIKSPAKEAVKKSNRIEQNANKSILNDFPRIIPFLNQNKTSGSHFGTKKARKFVNTMMMKSATFRKALFPLIMGNNKCENPKNDAVEVEAIQNDIEARVDETKGADNPSTSEGTSLCPTRFSSSTFALSTTAITVSESVSSTNKAVNPINLNNSTYNLSKNNPTSSKNISLEKLNISESCK